jgi:CrcB protein
MGLARNRSRAADSSYLDNRVRQREERVRALLVGVAGAAGALSRYGIAVAIGPQLFPWATLGINLSGSFVLAFVVTWATEGHLPTDIATGITVGFLGAYTTFSTFSYETFVMGHVHRSPNAIIYVGVSVLGGIACAAAGYGLGRVLR